MSGRNDFVEISGGYVNRAARAFAEHNGGRLPENAIRLAAALKVISAPAPDPVLLMESALARAGRQMAEALNQATQNAGNMFKSGSEMIAQIKAGALRTNVTDNSITERQFGLGITEKGLKSERVVRQVITIDNFPAGTKVSAGSVRANIATSPQRVMHSGNIAAIPLVDDRGYSGSPHVHVGPDGIDAGVFGPGAIFISGVTFVDTGSAMATIEITGPSISR